MAIALTLFGKDLNKHGLNECVRLYSNSRAAKQKNNNIREFKPPVPVREISLVTYRHFVKTRMLETLKHEIISSVVEHLSQKKKQKVIEI